MDKEKAIGQMFDVGIYNYSNKMEMDDREALRQMIYCYYREQEYLSPDLLAFLDENADFFVDEDYHGFQGNVFNPVIEIESLTDIFNARTEIWHMVKKQMQIRASLKSFDGISCDWANGERIDRSHQGEPHVSIKVEMLKRKYYSLDDFDIIQFCAYAGIKSIGGRKNVFATNKKHILARMFGFRDHRDMDANKYHFPELLPLIDKYSKKYHMDKLLKLVKADGFVRDIHAQRGDRVLYINKGLSEDAFIEHIAGKHRNAKIKRMNEQSRELARKISKKVNK